MPIGSASRSYSRVSTHSSKERDEAWALRLRPFGLTGSSAMNLAQENSSLRLRVLVVVAVGVVVVAQCQLDGSLITPYPVRGGTLAPLLLYPPSSRNRLPLRQHTGIAPLDNVSHRHPAQAVVPRTVGVLHLRAPGHATADPNSAASILTATPRPTSATHHHPAPLALAPAQHLHLGGHDPLLRLRPLEEDPVQTLQNARRRAGLAIHDLREMGRAYPDSPGNLVLAEPVGVHPLPDGLPVDAGALRRRNLGRSLQRRLHPGWTFTPMFLCPRDTYKTIFVGGAFGLGGDRQQDWDALRCFYQHLKPGGVLLLDNHLPYENARSWQYWLKEKQRQLPEAWPPSGDRRLASDGAEYEMRGRLVSVDPLEQLVTRQIRVQLWRERQLVEEEQYTLKERYYFRNELLMMLEKVGFGDVKVQSGYTGTEATAEDGVLVLIAMK